MANKKSRTSKENIAEMHKSSFDQYATTRNIEICKYIAYCLNTIINDSNDWCDCGRTPCIYIDHDSVPILKIRLRKKGISLNIHKDVIADDDKEKYSSKRTRESDSASYIYALNKIYSSSDERLHELLVDIRKTIGIQLLDHNCFPECEDIEEEFVEGSKKQITVNSYERNREAREKCLKYYGSYKCQICGFESSEVYGDEFFGLIHVHHIVPISKKNREYKLDPIADLIPVCPNCHMLIHSTNGKHYSIEQIKEIVQKRRNL